MCEFDGLLPASGENVMSIVPLGIYFIRKLVTCSHLFYPLNVEASENQEISGLLLNWFSRNVIF